MTELLEQAVETARKLPAHMQDDIARMMLSLAGANQPVALTAEEEADLLDAEAEVERGEFASDEEIRALWEKRRA